MIAPRRPLKPRLVRLRSRVLPAARGLRRRATGSGAGWLPVGLRWRRVARPVSHAAAPRRVAAPSPREGRTGWRTRTLLLPAARAPRHDAARGLPGPGGLRGSPGAALRGEPGARGAMSYRAGPSLQPQPRSHTPAAPPAPPVRHPLLAASRSALPPAPVAAARLAWVRRAPAAAAALVHPRAPAKPESRTPVSRLLRWLAPAEAPRPGRRQIAAAAPRTWARTHPAAGLSQRSEHQGAHHAPTGWRVSTRSATVPARADAVTAAALARHAELVWRAAPAAAQSSAPAASMRADRRLEPGGYADAPASAAPPSVACFTAAAPAPAAVLDAAATERLVDDVLRRAEQRLRIERERRGI